MGGYTNAILAAIGNIGQARAQNQLQRGQIYGGLAQQLGNAPMNYLAIQRGVNENQFRQTQQAEQERKLKAEAELRQLISDAPDGPTKWMVTRNWAAANDPEMAIQMDKMAYEAATNQYKATAGTPGPTPEATHAPIEFPSIAGRPAFSVTPQTQQQVQEAGAQQLSIVEQIKAMAGRFEKQPEIASREMEGQKNRENAMAIARLREQTEKDVKVGETITPQNKKIAVYKRPDGTTYQVDIGPARPPQQPATLKIYAGEDIDQWAEALGRGEVQMTEIPAPIRGKVLAKTRGTGNAVVPKQTRAQITALKTAKNLAAPLRQMVNDVVNAKDPAERVRASLILKNYGKATSGRIARAFGEVGAMTEGDINRATGLIPGIVSSNFDPGYAKRELDWLDSLLASQEKTLKEGSFATVPVGGGGAAGGGGDSTGGKARFRYDPTTGKMIPVK